MDVAEVGFEPLSGIVVERDERHALRPSLGPKVLPDALVAAGVSVFVAQAPKNFGDGVPLLGRRLLVGANNGVDEGFEGIDDRRHRLPLIRLGLRLPKDLPDLPPRMVELAGQLANAQPVDAMRLADACVLVHLDHPSPPVAGTLLKQ